MRYYRAYPIGNDGHVLPPTIIAAEDDRAAIVQTKAMLNEKPIELWDQSRLVVRLEKSSQTCEADFAQGAACLQVRIPEKRSGQKSPQRNQQNETAA